MDHQCYRACRRCAPPLPNLPLLLSAAGCLKNVLVVWGGVLQGDVITARELQARAALPCLPALPALRPPACLPTSPPACLLPTCLPTEVPGRLPVPLPAGLHDLSGGLCAVLCLPLARRSRRGGPLCGQHQPPESTSLTAGAHGRRMVGGVLHKNMQSQAYHLILSTSVPVPAVCACPPTANCPRMIWAGPTSF